ncbi:hypothetical protein THIX_20556 [Thiomonas sp. X19]|nr:hypothetical protein THIX_20556 [Thiomonas sp. X19]
MKVPTSSARTNRTCPGAIARHDCLPAAPVQRCAQSFPTLFDLVDGSSTGEVDGVDKQNFWKVVDQCYICDLCYMTQCPYVPPHPWSCKCSMP